MNEMMMSPADIRAVTDGDGSNTGFGNGGMWIFALLILLALLGGGFGVNVPGATASVAITTANTQIENIGIVAIIRVLCCGDAALTVSVGGTTAPTISNLAITVTRE